MLFQYLSKIWCPPTPPQDDSDVYIDYSLAHMYETRVMDESRLPPVYVHKELKRVHKESINVQPDDGTFLSETRPQSLLSSLFHFIGKNILLIVFSLTKAAKLMFSEDLFTRPNNLIFAMRMLM